MFFLGKYGKSSVANWDMASSSPGSPGCSTAASSCPENRRHWRCATHSWSHSGGRPMGWLWKRITWMWPHSVPILRFWTLNQMTRICFLFLKCGICSKGDEDVEVYRKRAMNQWGLDKFSNNHWPSFQLSQTADGNDARKPETGWRIGIKMRTEEHRYWTWTWPIWFQSLTFFPPGSDDFAVLGVKGGAATWRFWLLF